MSHKITDFLLDSKRVGTRLILTKFGFRLRAAFVILSDALAESNCEAAPKAESKRLYAQNDRFIFFQSYSVTEPIFITDRSAYQGAQRRSLYFFSLVATYSAYIDRFCFYKPFLA